MFETVETNWDEICKYASFEKMRELAPGIQHVPTMYNVDGSRIYLSSVDYEAMIDSIDDLKFQLTDVLKSFVSELDIARQLKIPHWNIVAAKKIHFHQIDIIELCKLIVNINGHDSVCDYPEKLIQDVASGVSIEDIMELA